MNSSPPPPASPTHTRLLTRFTSTEFDWLIGVALSLMATLAGTVGKVMMKLSHNRALAAGVPGGKKAGKSGGLFYMGLMLNVVVNPVGYALAYNFASQSLIVPLSALAIVFNTFMAPAVLGEKLSKEDWYGAMVIFGGAILVGVGADRSEQDFDPEDIDALYSKGLFLTFVAAEIGWIGFLAVYMISSSSAREDDAQASLLRKLAWGSAGGTIGGNQFFIKAAVVYIEHGEFDSALSWITYIGAASSAVLGLVLMNAGLHRYEAVFVVPMYQSFLILFGTITAMTFFREFENYSDWQWAVWVPGVVVTILGILILSLHFTCCGLWKSSDQEEEEEEHAKAVGAAAAGIDDDSDTDAAARRAIALDGLEMEPARRPSEARSEPDRYGTAAERHEPSRLSMRMDYALPGGMTPEADRDVSERRRRRVRRTSERSRNAGVGGHDYAHDDYSDSVTSGTVTADDETPRVAHPSSRAFAQRRASDSPVAGGGALAPRRSASPLGLRRSRSPGARRTIGDTMKSFRLEDDVLAAGAKSDGAAGGAGVGATAGGAAGGATESGPAPALVDLPNITELSNSRASLNSGDSGTGRRSRPDSPSDEAAPAVAPGTPLAASAGRYSSQDLDDDFVREVNAHAPPPAAAKPLRRASVDATPEASGDEDDSAGDGGGGGSGAYVPVPGDSPPSQHEI